MTCDGVRWLLDTGATGVVLFSDVDLDVETSSRTIRRVATNDGARVARSGWIRRLKIGGESFPRVPVTLARQTGFEDHADGLLPGTLFASIYVDHEQNIVVLNPR